MFPFGPLIESVLGEGFLLAPNNSDIFVRGPFSENRCSINLEIPSEVDTSACLSLAKGAIILDNILLFFLDGLYTIAASSETSPLFPNP